MTTQNINTQSQSLQLIQNGRGTVDSSKLFAMFQHASAHLKRPGIRLSCDGTKLKIKWKGNKIYVNRRESFGYTFATISDDGNIYFANMCNIVPNLPRLLALLCRAPETVVSEFGRLTGHCCFCWLPLTDERSTAKGYGPICAGHYNLPWGE